MLRWGIAGTGFISDTLAEAIGASRGSVASAVAGRDLVRVQAFRERHRIAAAHSSYEALLADESVDIVYVALPNHVHHDATMNAVVAGKHVLCEKSLSIDMDKTHAMLDAVAASGVFFMEGLMYLAHPVIAALVEVLRSGCLGTLRSISASYAADIWRVVNPQGMGALYNLGCYPVSLVQLVVQTAFGPDMFGSARMVGTGNLSPVDGNVCEAALAMHFETGLIASLHTAETYGMAHDFRIVGDRGCLHFVTNPWLPKAGRNVFAWRPFDGGTEERVVETSQDAFFHQVRAVEQNIAAARIQAERPLPTWRDSQEVMAVLTRWESLVRGEGPASPG